jgi:SAM-dependent methyltransferase
LGLANESKNIEMTLTPDELENHDSGGARSRIETTIMGNMHAVQPSRHDLACLDVTTMRGLEIGPLASPRVLKGQGAVLYVDHADAEGLRYKYSTDPIMRHRLDEIVEVDYVLAQDQRLHDTVASDAPFDYVIASHLIEHIPDPVSWLADIAKALRVGGILSLVIPDKRYCFDLNRRTTDISEIVDSHLRQLRRPSFKQVYDFISKEITGQVDTAAIWAGTANYSDTVRSDVEDPDIAALQLCRTVANSEDFVDVHCNVFTPDSFLELYEKLARLGLIDFEIAYFAPTERNNLEFFVSLRRVEPELGREAILERQLDSIPRPHTPTSPDSTRPDRSGTGAFTLEVSEMERKLIAAKRRALAWIRTSQWRNR